MASADDFRYAEFASIISYIFFALEQRRSLDSRGRDILGGRVAGGLVTLRQ